MATARIICGFDTFACLRTTGSFAGARQSLTIHTIDSFNVIGATTPPRQRPHEPPVFPKPNCQRPEATLLQHKPEPRSPSIDRFFGNLLIIQMNWR